MSDIPDDVIERLVQQIHARGLATPTLMLFDTFAPLGFLGEQTLVALGPLLPVQNWRTAAANLLHILQQPHAHERLRHLLIEPAEPKA